MTETKSNQKIELLQMATTIVASYVGANQIAPENIPALIASVKKSLMNEVETETDKTGDKPKPAITVNKSVTDDYIICLEDGKKLKMLKRYLRSNYGMSPDEYRKRWGLPADYPMVAPNYAEKRSNFAKKIGLGRGVRGR